MWFQWMIDADLPRQAQYTAPVVTQHRGRWTLEEALVRPCHARARDPHWRALAPSMRKGLGLHCDQLGPRFGLDGHRSLATGVAVVRAKLGYLFGPPNGPRTAHATFRYTLEVTYRSQGVRFAIADDNEQHIVVAVRHDNAPPSRIRTADKVLWELLLRAPLLDFHADFPSGATYGCDNGQPYATRSLDPPPTSPTPPSPRPPRSSPNAPTPPSPPPKTTSAPSPSPKTTSSKKPTPSATRPSDLLFVPALFIWVCCGRGGPARLDSPEMFPDTK